jgi:hypothetical protein
MTENNNFPESETKLTNLRQDFEATKVQIQVLDYVTPGSLQMRL